ncbi:hypothetical protein [Kribbella sp. NPDC004875]|uniref:hypothetical protein n=1 Tax=Kribbella sp. NPDC004875 TaxID=3364107 RepID=UPI0036A021A0
MPDTDDGKSESLELDQREQGDDDTEAASERRAARARAEAAKSPTHDLAEDAAERRAEEEVQARHDAEDEAARAEELDLDALDEKERDELRDRADMVEARRAREIAFADDAAATADRYRGLAASGRQRELDLQARGQHRQDQAAADPDAPGADELDAQGRRNMRASQLEGYQVNADIDTARAYEDRAERHRANAREEQAPAADAVRTRPQEAATAQAPQDALHRRDLARTPEQKKKQQQRRSPQPVKIDLDLP